MPNLAIITPMKPIMNMNMLRPIVLLFLLLAPAINVKAAITQIKIDIAKIAFHFFDVRSTVSILVTVSMGWLG